jgi:hypothetical protein
VSVNVPGARQLTSSILAESTIREELEETVVFLIRWVRSKLVRLARQTRETYLLDVGKRHEIGEDIDAILMW